MQHIEVFNNLKKSINEKGLSLLFLRSIKDLKNHFGEEVSTKFLRGLCDSVSDRAKTKRINFLIRKNKLKTKRTYRIYEVRGTNKYKVDVIDWGHDKKNLPFKQAELTDKEKREIQEIRQLQEETGINLFNHAEDNFNNRKKTTDAFNLDGGAIIKDVKVIDVGKYLVTYHEEVLYMVIENVTNSKASKVRIY